jgi:hypothetical protein
MARGWESKSVESQIESAEARRTPSAGRRSTEQSALERERNGLELSRTRVLRDLASAASPRRREMLEAALKHLEERLAALK